MKPTVKYMLHVSSLINAAASQGQGMSPLFMPTTESGYAQSSSNNSAYLTVLSALNML